MVDLIFFGIGISLILIILMSIAIYVTDLITDYKNLILHTFCLLICLFLLVILLFIGLYTNLLLMKVGML